MKNGRSIWILALSAAMALPAGAASDRTPITAAQIADAISGAGMKVSAQQVTLLAEVVSSTSNPTLRVESMERWGDRRMKVRLDCASSDQCLPFLVAVDWSDGDTVQLPSSADRSTAAISPARPGSNSYVVRSGSPAILLLDSDHVHIQLSVICLENGAVGQTVRVASKDHRQNFSAQVVDGTLLKGRL